MSNTAGWRAVKAGSVPSRLVSVDARFTQPNDGYYVIDNEN